MEKTLTPAMEDYLELILNLRQENKVVRVRDIARGMDVKMPSVTSMLNNLAKKNLINHEKYEYVELTPYGLKKAREALRKHTILFNFLKNILNVDPTQADIDACGMEHAISPATLKKLVAFIEFVEFCPRAGFDWLEYFKNYCQEDRSKEKCAKHMKDFIKKFPSRVKSYEIKKPAEK
ncbi:MAG: metal-dependent transcriptional regulator [Deltaproteobacteria bacterium]|nr:metal-dependent transcriptional regulator [Deltaproteobacteria bacterium]